MISAQPTCARAARARRFSPIYHVALLRRIGAEANSAVLNLGGVGNITWWGGEDRIIGFDTGPANAPLNDWIRRHGQGEMDRDGSLARRGKVDEPRLAELCAIPIFQRLIRNRSTATISPPRWRRA